MDISEIKERRRVLEADIEKKIDEFQSETGVYVESVDIENKQICYRSFSVFYNRVEVKIGIKL